MLPTQRSNLISRGLAMIQGFHATTITFPGESPIPASRRASASGALAGLGGLSDTTPSSFLVLASDLAVLTLQPKITTFTSEGVLYLLQDVTAQPGEPHLRLTADLASR